MILDMRDISKSYPLGKEPVPVLKHIDLQVVEGDYLAIMGPSGSGKTTLMNIIGCLDTPTSGQYFLAGEDVSKAGGNRLADIRNSALGFVFQSFHLLPKLDALDNVALPLLYAGVPKSARRRRAAAALNTVGLSDRLHHRPNQLSGGQCQRVAIARAMALQPDILCFDEPTSALDPELTGEVLKVIRQLAEEKMTMIIVTHEIEFARNVSDQVIFMAEGVIVEQGAPEAVIDNPHQERTKAFLREVQR